MKRLLNFLIIIIMILFVGCGTGTANTETDLINSVTPSATPSIASVTVAPTATIAPTATPVPTLSPEEAKYHYYDESYIDNPDAVSMGEAKALTLAEAEAFLEQNYYRTWYDYSYDQSKTNILIDQFTRDGKEYGIKCISADEYSGHIIYYLYFDSPDTIYADYVYFDEIACILEPITDSMEGGAYCSIPLEEYDSIAEELYAPEYTPATLDTFYEHAKKLAKKYMLEDLGGLYDPYSLYNIFEYSNERDVYFEYDGDYTYYINFDAEYHCLFNRYPYRIETVYTDRNKDYNFEVRSFNIRSK